MGREEYQMLGGGVVKRKAKRRIGLFIDGVGLDRATRRVDRKVDLSKLVRGLTQGLQPEVARYYTLVPNEDDARQFSFLDAVERAGLEVIVKRLPPKGVKRQVSMDVHIAADLISFGYGYFDKHTEEEGEKSAAASAGGSTAAGSPEVPARILDAQGNPLINQNVKRLATVVCPSREISYAMFLCHTLSVETSLADFGLYGTSDGWNGVDRWVDLSTSEMIWRE